MIFWTIKFGYQQVLIFQIVVFSAILLLTTDHAAMARYSGTAVKLLLNYLLSPLIHTLLLVDADLNRTKWWAEALLDAFPFCRPEQGTESVLRYTTLDPFLTVRYYPHLCPSCLLVADSTTCTESQGRSSNIFSVISNSRTPCSFKEDSTND